MSRATELGVFAAFAQIGEDKERTPRLPEAQASGNATRQVRLEARSPQLGWSPFRGAEQASRGQRGSRSLAKTQGWLLSFKGTQQNTRSKTKWETEQSFRGQMFPAVLSGGLWGRRRVLAAGVPVRLRQGTWTSRQTRSFLKEIARFSQP